MTDLTIKPGLGKALVDHMAKRVSETDAMFGASIAAESKTASTDAPLSPAEKLAALQEHQKTYSTMTGIPQDLLFQSQAEYDAALAALPEPTHDAAGNPYSNGDSFLLKLKDAAIEKALNPQPSPDAELMAQIHRDELMATPAQTTFEDSVHTAQVPTTVAEWIQAAEELNRLANQHGLFVLRIAGSQFPLSLGPGGAVREIEQLRLSTDPFGNNVLAQGSLAAMRTALDFEIRERTTVKQKLALMEQYREQKAAEFADAQREHAQRTATPALVQELLSVVQDLRDEVSVLKAERVS
jgi:hypothetical protein